MATDNTTRIGRTPFRHALINANHLLKTGTLAIKAGASPLARTTTTLYALINGTLVTFAAGDMPALSGTVADEAYNVFAFFIKEDGTRRSAMGTAGATLGAVEFPPRADDEAVIGFIVVHPTGGAFVGGTTALDDGTVIPAAVYVDTVYPFDPTWSAKCDE